MSRSIRYSKISNLNQLRNERARLDSDITNKELLLSLQCREITEYFSLANMVSFFVSRVNSLAPLFTWVQSAFNFFWALLGNNNKEEEILEKQNVTKQTRKKSEKSTTPPVKKPATQKRNGKNRVKSAKGENRSMKKPL